MLGSMFSESWYKVSNLQVKLNTNQYIRKQKYRGVDWYVIEDRYNNQFFKITPESYQFLMRLSLDRTVEEVWEEFLELYPNIVPTQDEVIHLLISLHHKNLLQFNNVVDSQELYNRDRMKKIAQVKGKVFSFLYFKVPLFDPDKLLDKVKTPIDIIFSKLGLIIWFIVIFLGLKFALENINLIYDQSQGMLSPNNIFLLYISIIVLKTLHEFGHSMMVKKFGGKVNTMGVVILIFTPIPYMDATQSWLFRSKYQRALVGSAGMIVELFFAAIATIIWANTGDGVLNSICFNIMIIGSISSIFFNGNPLLRFDSYFILSDLIEIPNLYEKSKKQWYYWVEKYLFNLPNVISPSITHKEAFWMGTYAFFSLLYRLFVALIIAIFVADQWFLLGVLVVMVSIYMWVLKPLVSFTNYLLYDVKLYKNRFRAMGVSASFTFVVFTLVVLIPFGYSIKADGVVVSESHQSIYIKTDGYLEEIKVKSGEHVKKDDILITFSNEEVDFEIKKITYSIIEAKAYLQKATTSSKGDIAAVKEHIELLKSKLDFFESKKTDLFIKAPHDGFFVYDNDSIKYMLNKWYKKGEKIGMLIPNEDVYFKAVVTQDKSSELFKSEELYGEIKFFGNPYQTIEAKTIDVIPYEKTQLPSAALGWLGGGDIPVSTEDPSGTKTTESFFEVIVEVNNLNDINLYHGRMGVLKIKLENMTLIDRTILSVKQILQKHYKI